jgi:ribokinase
MKHPPTSRDAVIVVGIRCDQFSHVTRIPRPGETVLAHSLGGGLGGQGANQAVGAARLGADVTLVSMVGRDAAGSAAIAELQRRSVATSEVARAESAD